MMSKKDKIDFDEELERLAHKTNFNVRKSEYSFENQLKKLDQEIDDISNKKIKEFDKNKELAFKHMNTNYKTDSLERYREKLRKI